MPININDRPLINKGMHCFLVAVNMNFLLLSSIIKPSHYYYATTRLPLRILLYKYKYKSIFEILLTKIE